MSAQNTDLYIVAIGLGGTWGTAIDLTGVGVGYKMYVTSLELASSREQFIPRDIGFAGQRKFQKLLGIDGTITLTCDLTFGQMWTQIVAAFMGISSVPAEQTGGEGDYLHSFTMADNATNFSTLVWTPETDEVIEIPSIKWNQIQFTLPAANVGTFTATGQISDVVNNANAVNNYSDVSGLTFLNTTYEPVCIGGTNHYFRLDDYSDSVALTNADDKEIITTQITLNREHFMQKSLRAGATFDVPLPRDNAQITGQLSVTLDEIDSSVLDSITEWLASDTRKMAEIFVDGSQIGAGENRSYKWQFPQLRPASEVPQGYGIEGPSVFPTPTQVYEIFAVPDGDGAASGITDKGMMTFQSIEERSTAYI